MANTSALSHRYPGAQPFRRSQERIFCGRAEDIARLHRAITLNELTVLYGESGLGKTSLLNAGVLPRFTEVDLLAVFPRFYAYVKSRPVRPLDAVREQMGVHVLPTAEEHAETGVSAPTVFMPSVQKDAAHQTLWQQVKSIQWHNRKKYTGIIIVFDQFEELFTYPDAEIERFGEEFGELLHNRMPTSFREQFYKVLEENPQAIDSEELEFIEHALPTKIVLGIRHDRLGLLKRISTYYPNILLDQNLFQLKALEQKQAEDAIRLPALLGGPEDPYLHTKGYTPPQFDTKWFKYHPDTLKTILHYLTDGGEKPVETTQLQIICQHIETKVVHAEGQVVMVDEVGDLGQISQNYYDNVIHDLPKKEQQTVRDMIEKGLIFEADQLRLSLYSKQIRSLYPTISDTTLEALVDSHLLRAEERSGERVYEISHDSLVAPILRAKKIRDDEAERERLIAEAEAERKRMIAEAEAERKRLHEEAKAERAREEAARAQREAEEKAARQAAEDEAERQRLRRQRSTLWRFSLIAGVLAFVALTAAGFAFYQTRQARQARADAVEQRNLAITNFQKAELSRDTAIQLKNELELAQRQFISETYQRRYEQGNLLMAQKRYAEALPNLEEALGIEAPERNEAELRQLIAKCRQEIPKETRFNDLMRRADELRDQKAPDYLAAYPLYKQARDLNFDNPSAQQKLEFCRSELRNKLDEELRRAKTFLDEGKNCADAEETFEQFVRPILQQLELSPQEDLRKKSERIRLQIQRQCSRNK